MVNMNKKGFFTEEKGGYEITDYKVRGDWQYIYQNKDVLLRVDQCGVAMIQANPVNDIYLLKRDGDERFSKWIVWIGKDGGEFQSNFAYPKPHAPKNGRIRFLPEKATYWYEYDGFEVETELFIPEHGTAVVCTVSVTNTGKDVANFSFVPAVRAYVNGADYDIWDKAEWYNNTSVCKDGDLTVFYTKRLSPHCIKSERRLATFLCEGLDEVDIRAEAFVGLGSFACPDGLQEKMLWKTSELSESFTFPEQGSLGGLPFVYAGRKNVEIKAGEKKTFTQVFSMQDKSFCGEFSAKEYEPLKRFFNAKTRENEIEKVKAGFEKTFASRTLKTDDPVFDQYVNEFLPLQLGWVASLDRGWPTGLRGTRDAANDFMGIVYYDETWARKVLFELYSGQLVNGWLPRQVPSVVGSRKVDLRKYSDSGAFLMEFLHEYIRHTGDMSALNEEIGFFDSEEKTTLLDHLLRSIEHYLLPENIGEHGLCKIYNGDWLDALNNAGLKGRGESVMVTCQLAMSLKDTANLLRYLGKEEDRANRYEQKAEDLLAGVLNAYNGEFFNGAFTDEGRWVFSDCDEDGEKRPYGPSNYYALCSGAAKGKEETVLRSLEKLRTPIGYKLCDPALGRKPMSCVGRMGSGDQQIGIWENGNVYNHAQGFRIRALASVGKGDELYETLRFLLPYDEEIHDPNVTLSPPYAMLNCYQGQPLYDGMAGSPYLTGSIAMAERAVYRWMLGIVPELDELKIQPCLKKGKTDICASFTLRGKRLTVRYTGNNTGKTPKIQLDGKQTEKISYQELKDGSEICVILQ